MTIAYDGTRYAGWQVQKGSGRQSAVGTRQKERPTIQGTLEHVLRQILQEPVKVVGSGRTDAGVHALAQVAHVRTHSTLPRERLLHSLNRLLPPEIAVTRLDDVPASFHARFLAVRKHYRYRLYTGTVVTPFLCPYVYHVRVPLNVSLMRREAAALRGRHDFTAFVRTGQSSRTTVRVITHIRLTQRQDELRLDMEGTGFLHTMARGIAGTLIDVGRGRLPPGTIRCMLRTGDRSLAGTTAPAKGLTLIHVNYAKRRSAR